jgi:hypothetical protein
MAEPRPLVFITGCGASGTGYISKILKRAGLQIGHEFISRDGMSSWLAVAGDLDPRDPAWYKAMRKRWGANIRLDHFPSVPIILHQTRYPLHTISTAQRFVVWSWRFICQVLQQRNIDIDIEMPLTKRCMLYWYHWNVLIEEVAEWQYRIEDLQNCFCQLCIKMQRPELCQKQEELFKKQTTKYYNSRPNQYQPLSWSDLTGVDADLTKQIQVLAWHYGYRC